MPVGPPKDPFGSVGVAVLSACLLAAAARRRTPSETLLLSTIVRDDPANKAEEPAAFGALAQPEEPSREDPDAFDASRVLPMAADVLAALHGGTMIRAEIGLVPPSLLTKATVREKDSEMKQPARS